MAEKLKLDFLRVVDLLEEFLYSQKKYCPVKGSRVVIYGEWCDRRKAEQLRAAREEDLKALKNPFLPYYDEYFRKYR